MADRIVKVILRGDITDLKAKMAAATGSVKSTAASMTAGTAEAAKFRAGLTTVGTAATRAGLVAAAGVGLITKAAIDWETAWAGVTKTVSGSAAELDRLEGQLREMARTMPATHAEIAAVAEAAGQLGVATNDIASFTKVMIELGETTNLTAEEAATSIAQIANVMQTAPGDIDNLGAALVALGNNGASTERDIIQMAQNIAGAGKTVGLSETDVLGLANALSSVGIEAQAGGSAVSKILIDMAKAVQTNSSDLKVWASAAGESVSEFSRQFEETPAEAFDAFTQGLGRIDKEGGDVFGLLEDLGQSDVRVTRALLGMANSGDLLSNSLQLGADSFRENTALANEYGKRAETSASQTRVAWNDIKDSAIDAGEAILPVVASVAGGIGDMASAFSRLPGPVKSSVGVLSAFGAGSLLAVGAAAKLVTSVAAARKAMDELGLAQSLFTKRQLLVRGALLTGSAALIGLSADAHKTNDGLGVLTDTAGGLAAGFAVGGPVGAAIGGATGLLYGLHAATSDTGNGMEKAKQKAYDYAASLDQVSGAATKATKALVFEDLRKAGAVQNASALGIASRDLVSSALGQAEAIKRVKAAINDALVEGNPVAVGVAGELLDVLSDINAAFDSQQGEIQESNAATQSWAQALQGLPKEVQVELANLNYAPTAAEVDALREKYHLTPAQVQTILEATDNATQTMDPVEAALRALDQYHANPTIGVNDQASHKINVIRGEIAGLHGKTINIETRHTYSSAGGSGRTVASSAHGNIFEAYATGGLRVRSGIEDHIAQIAEPGTPIRMWNEPETPGEAFIPTRRTEATS